MASAQENDASAAANHMTYKDALVEGVPDSELETDFQPDPAVIATQQEDKEKAEASKDEKNDGTESLKTNLLISGAVIAVIGAIFAIVKKIKEA